MSFFKRRYEYSALRTSDDCRQIHTSTGTVRAHSAVDAFCKVINLTREQASERPGQWRLFDVTLWRSGDSDAIDPPGFVTEILERNRE